MYCLRSTSVNQNPIPHASISKHFGARFPDSTPDLPDLTRPTKKTGPAPTRLIRVSGSGRNFRPDKKRPGSGRIFDLKPDPT